MEILVSAVTGIAIKVYDDISDNKFTVSETYLEVLKTFQIVGLTILSIHDFNFSLFLCLMNILSFVGDPSAYVTDQFHKSILILYPILVILSFPYKTQLNIVSILYVLCFLTFFAVEPYIVPEEYSEKKGVIRLITSVVVFIGLFVGHYFGVSMSFLKIGIICLGYIFTSTLFQFYILSQNNDKLLQAITLHAKSYSNRVRCCMVSSSGYIGSNVSIRATSVQCKNLSS